MRCLLRAVDVRVCSRRFALPAASPCFGPPLLTAGGQRILELELKALAFVCVQMMMAVSVAMQLVVRKQGLQHH